MENYMSLLQEVKSVDWAVLIACAAATFTGYQALLMRKHNRLSVKPHLSTWTTDTQVGDDYVIYFYLENNGLGPAIIQKFEVFFDEAKIGDCYDRLALNKRMSEKVEEQKGITKHIISLLGLKTAFPAGKKEVLFAIHMPMYMGFSKQAYADFMDRFDLNLEYSSVYGGNEILCTINRKGPK